MMTLTARRLALRVDSRGREHLVHVTWRGYPVYEGWEYVGACDGGLGLCDMFRRDDNGDRLYVPHVLPWDAEWENQQLSVGRELLPEIAVRLLDEGLDELSQVELEQYQQWLAEQWLAECADE